MKIKSLQQLDRLEMPEHLKNIIREEFKTLSSHPMLAVPAKKKKNKYHNEHVYVCVRCDTILEIIDLKKKVFRCFKCGKVKDYIFFPSKKESNYYFTLQVLKRCGDVVDFEMQVPFKIVLDSGDVIVYRLDFLVHYPMKRTEYVDVKGKRLPEYIMKKKLVEDRYKIKITEV